MAQNKKNKVIFLAAGGTGGHLFPAQSLGEALIEKGHKIHMVTDKRGVGFSGALSNMPVHRVLSSTFKPGFMGKLRTFTLLFLGLLQSLWLIIRYRPAMCIGFGGYPSFPFMKASQLLGRKTIVHESNAVLGVANKILAKSCDAVATSLSDLKGIREQDKHKITVTGNPVRDGILKAAKKPYTRPSDNKDFHLFITGGSQGAHIFGDVIPKAIAKLPEPTQKRLVITQQCRKDDLERVKEAYEGLAARVEIAPFFNNIADLIADAHLVICRSGASTVSEIAVIGRPAIFVPLTVHADQQQKLNASALVEKDAAIMMVEDSFTPETLCVQLETLMQLDDKLNTMAHNAKACGVPDATENMVWLVESFLEDKDI